MENTRSRSLIENPVWRQGPLFWAVILALLPILGAVYWQGLTFMVGHWDREEYSHGYLIPFIVLFLIWQKKDVLERLEFGGAWLGLAGVALGIFVFVAGELSTLYTVVQYGFFITLAGAVLAWLGWQPFAVVAVPLLIAVFMVPLPDFLYNNLSAQLQLVSSELGVWFIRLFGISVFLEGNVIDLGTMKLQVVEACDGLRYLFPLMTLAFIVAYFYKGAFWKRVVLFLSSIPITIFMNSLRIGIIGVTVEFWGQDMAEGFLHDFQGWAVFMASFGVLLLLVCVLTFVPREEKPLRQLFGLDFPSPTPKNCEVRDRKIPAPLIASLVLLAGTALAAQTLPEREEIIPERERLASFPMQVGEWSGRADTLEQIYLDALKFEDYLLADYNDGIGPPVNFYVAYYESQRKGASIHSPRSCIPGGGWRITDLSQKEIAGANAAGQPLTVNRVQIELGESKQLVYYWFQQRGRIQTNEYLVKWFLFWDALTKNRTDGALVRLVVPVPEGTPLEVGDARLEEFARLVAPALEGFIPGSPGSIVRF